VTEIEQFETALEIEGVLRGRKILRIEQLGALSVRAHFTDGSWQDLHGLLAVRPCKQGQPKLPTD
jgi:hypothetical protein